MGNVEKSTWNKEAGYVWSLIGSAVGFANILSFSAMCYKNGGGAFLIPYILAHLFVGIPLLILEGIIGQRTKLPLVSAMGNAAGAKGRLLGWISVFTCATIGGFYIVLTGYSVAYAYFAAAGSLSQDSTFFFKEVFLKDSGSISVWGGLAVSVFLATVAVSIISWAVLIRNIQSGVEKICSLFLPLLGIMMGLFTLAACFLPGAIDGFRQYLIPDFSRLSNWTLWRDVFGQVFFTLSLGLGIVVGYSRHNPSTFNIPRAMLNVALGDFVISFISGFAIFGCIGFMSAQSGLPFSSIIQSDSSFEIGFIIFPTILAQFGETISRIVGPLFFFCVFIAGITGVFSIVESVAGNIEVEFKKSRKVAVGITMAIISLFAVPFCMGNGQHLLGALAPMVLGNAMLVGGISEIILFIFIAQSTSRDPVWFKGTRRTLYFHLLRFFVLPLLVVILLGAIANEWSGGFGLAEAVRWGWLAVVLACAVGLSRRQSAAEKPTVALADGR